MPQRALHRNGLYTERGIKQRDGYCSKWFRIEPEYAVKLSLALEDVGVPSNLRAWWPRPGSI